MRELLEQLLSADPNTVSTMRFCVLFTIIMTNVIFWYTWLFVCIWKRDIVNIPEGVVMAYAASQGLTLFGKGVQSFAEHPRYYETKPFIPTAKSNIEVR